MKSAAEQFPRPAQLAERKTESNFGLGERHSVHASPLDAADSGDDLIKNVAGSSFQIFAESRADPGLENFGSSL